MSCSDVGIPDRLHTSDYTSQPFNDDELVYRRFNFEGRPFSETPRSELFRLKKDSCNRSFYAYPEDVFYNSEAQSYDEHFHNCGVYFLRYCKVNGFEENFTVNKELRRIEIFIFHTPEECIYPHCEIFVYENGVPQKPGARLIKLYLRDFFYENAEVYREPSNP